MYWQREFLRKGVALPVGSYWREDLPKNGLLGGIQFHLRRAGITDSMIASQKWRLIDWVSKIEIIGNGATVIKSLPGTALHFVQWADGGGAGPDKHFNYGSSTKRCHLQLNFGRRMFDPVFGLDLSKWDSVEVFVYNDGTSTYFAGDWTVDALCYYLREPVEPGFSGFFRTETWRQWTTVADERKYLELPTEEKIRRIVLQVLPGVDSNNAAKTTPYTVVDDIELSLRSGVLKVWDASLRELWYENYFDLGRDVIQPLEPYTSDGKGVWTGVGQTLGLAGARMPHAGAQNTYGTCIVPGLDSSTQEREVPTDAEQDSWLVMGLALENCAMFRFDQLDDPAHYLDPALEKTVKLDIHTANDANAAGGTVRVITDRFVPA